jgi:ribosomal protein L11 methyltransferase
VGTEGLMQSYFLLRIELSREQLSWLSARLSEQGFPAYEEQASARGVVVAIYHPSRGRLQAVQRLLEQGAVRRWPGAQLGFTLSAADMSWALEWTRHLVPVQLTPGLMLFPHAPAGPPKAHELYLTPAFAFGFGEHPSTRLIASWLEQACADRPGCSVLDVGCGTGVLALVARASGAGGVVGVDISRDAVVAARANAALNQLAQITFVEGSIADVVGPFDVVVANIEANVLLELCGSLAGSLRSTGALALAGLIDEQCGPVIAAYEAAGVSLVVAGHSEDWCLLVGRPM